jgi:hypothetical protein
VRSLAEAFFSPDGEVGAHRLDSLVGEVDAYLSPASKTLRFGLLVILFVIRWSPLLYFRLSTFDDMSVGERVLHLERLERSRVATLALLVFSYKTILTMIFYEDRDEQDTLGYPGAERRRWKRGLPVLEEAR